MGYIYKITNKINNKIYIGKTSSTIQKRWKQHLSDYKRDSFEKRPLYNAMKKYGEENFSIEEIEEVEESLLSEREIYWIEYYNSYKNGYNATLGGEGTTLYNYQEIYDLYKSGLFIKEIAARLNACQETISYVLSSYGIDKNEKLKRSYLKTEKPVIQLDKNNSFICQYLSLRQAARELCSDPKNKCTNVNAAKTHISEVCKGQRKTAYGYKWRFLEHNDN